MEDIISILSSLDSKYNSLQSSFHDDLITEISKLENEVENLPDTTRLLNIYSKLELELTESKSATDTLLSNYRQTINSRDGLSEMIRLKKISKTIKKSSLIEVDLYNQEIELYEAAIKDVDRYLLVDENIEKSRKDTKTQLSESLESLMRDLNELGVTSIKFSEEDLPENCCSEHSDSLEEVVQSEEDKFEEVLADLEDEEAPDLWLEEAYEELEALKSTKESSKTTLRENMEKLDSLASSNAKLREQHKRLRNKLLKAQKLFDEDYQETIGAICKNIDDGELKNSFLASLEDRIEP